MKIVRYVFEFLGTINMAMMDAVFQKVWSCFVAQYIGARGYLTGVFSFSKPKLFDVAANAT